MASPMDNALLNLWLKAGSLTRDQVRDIITEWQASRDEAAETERELGKQRDEDVAALEDENAELYRKVEDLRREVEDLRRVVKELRA